MRSLQKARTRTPSNRILPKSRQEHFLRVSFLFLGPQDGERKPQHPESASLRGNYLHTWDSFYSLFSISPSTARGHSAWAPPPSSSCPGPRPQSPISPPLHTHSHHTAPGLLWAPGGAPRSPEVSAGEKTAFLSSLVLFSLHKRASGRRLDTFTVLPGGVLCCVNPHGTLVL